MGSITVEGVEYEVENTYLRSIHLRPMRLMLDTPENQPVCFLKRDRHPRNKFHVVSSDGVRYWIKEYIWQHSGGTLWEAKQQKRYAGMVAGCKVGAVALVASDSHKIVMEYLEGYTSLNVMDNRDERVAVVDRVKVWLDHTNIFDYDVSANNVMVKGGVIKMIDFEKSNCVNSESQRKQTLLNMVNGWRAREAW